MRAQRVGHQADGEHAGYRDGREAHDLRGIDIVGDEGCGDAEQCGAREPQHRERNALALRLAAVPGDQHGGDDQQCAERPEPHRHIRRQRLEIGDDEGNDQQRADSEPADAAIFGRQ